MIDTPEIVVIATMRNEGPFILEWLGHHKAIGASRFLIFSNDCDDGTDVLLDRLHASGEVIHARSDGKGRSVQWAAINAAKGHEAYCSADWAICLDCDEFVNLSAPFETLQDLIAGHQDADAFALQWRFFGHAGHMHYVDMPVTERFQQAAPEAMLFPAASRFFKSLFVANRNLFAKPGVHRPKTRGSAERAPVWYDGHGQPLPKNFATDDTRILLEPATAKTRIAQINHYSLRSAEDFLIKRRRGLPNRTSKRLDATYWAERNFNTVADDSILRLRLPARTETERLLAIEGVKAAHDASVAAHKAQIATQLAVPEEAHFFTRLSLMPSSVPPDEETARKMLRILNEAQG